MAKALITIQDPWGPLAVAAECKNHGYQATILDENGDPISNPETPFQFVARYRIKYIKDNLKAALVPDLAKADRQAKIDEIDAIVVTIEQVQ